jgi:hypothetical protein
VDEIAADLRKLDLSSSDFAPLIAVHPPRLDANSVWWTPRCRDAQSNVMVVLRALKCFLDVLQCSEHRTHSVSDGSLPPGWGRTLPGPPSPVFLDGRLIHRLLAYAIYFFRHVDLQLVPSQVRSHIHAQSDEQGELPMCLNSRKPWMVSVAYLASVDKAGRRLLLPFVSEMPLATPSLPFCTTRSLICEDHCKMLVTSGPKHTPVREAGLLILNERYPRTRR